MTTPFTRWFPFAGPEKLPLWGLGYHPEMPGDEYCPKCGSQSIRVMALIVSWHLQCEDCAWYGSDAELVNHQGERVRKRTINSIVWGLPVNDVRA